MQQVCQNNLGLLELCRVDDIPVSKGSEQPVSSPAPHGRRHPRPAGAGLCHVAVDGSPAHRARRRAGVGEGRARASRRADRPCDRPPDQPGTGAAGRTRVADAVATAGDHGRRVRLPRQHHAGRGVEHQRGPRGRPRGLRRRGAPRGDCDAPRHLPDRVGAEPDREHRDDAELLAGWRSAARLPDRVR